jgi:hypothetical protein
MKFTKRREVEKIVRDVVNRIEEEERPKCTEEPKPAHFDGKPCELPLTALAKDFWPGGKFRFGYTGKKAKSASAQPVVWDNHICSATGPIYDGDELLRAVPIEPKDAHICAQCNKMMTCPAFEAMDNPCCDKFEPKWEPKDGSLNN